VQVPASSPARPGYFRPPDSLFAQVGLNLRIPLNSDETRSTHVLILAPDLPIQVMDQILTATEQSLMEAGATRVWAQRSTAGTVVKADLPAAACRVWEGRSA
jgi:hypothetical protein